MKGNFIGNSVKNGSLTDKNKIRRPNMLQSNKIKI